MVRILLLYISCLILCCSSYRTKEVYVSSEIGKDLVSCGTVREPCYSLGYMAKVIPTVRLTINLDGGNGTQLFYYLHESINITSCKIRKSTKSRLIPRISTKSHGRIAFNAYKSIMFSSIEFERVHIVKVMTKVLVEFMKCTFLNSKILDDTGSELTTIKISSSTVYSLHNTPLLIYVKNATQFDLTIKDCQMNGTGMYNSKSDFTVRIEKSIFRRFIWTLYGPRTHMNNLKVYDSVFLDKSIVKLKAYGRAYLKRNSFISSVLMLQTWKYLNIYHTNFSQNDKMFLRLRDLSYAAFDKSNFMNNTGRGLIMCTRVKKLNIKESYFADNHYNQDSISLKSYTCNGGALCLVLVNSTFISKSKFINNSGLQGGALHLWKSQVTIDTSTFLNNTAYEFGGTLYSEGNKRVSVINSLIEGPYNSRYKPLIGHLLYSKTAMRLQNITFIVNSNNVDNAVIVYIDTVQDVRSKKHTILSSFYLKCPVGYNTQGTFEKQSEQYKYISTKCIPCGKGKYSLRFGYSFKNESETEIRHKNVNCLSCPSGGVCNNRIESAGNYWGYANKNGHVEFIPCPMKYCCTRYGTPCVSYNTCERNREGKLCGKCKKGYSLDMWSLKCIENNKYYTLLYGVCHVIVAILYVAVFIYMKEIVLWIKYHMNFKEIKLKVMNILFSICSLLYSLLCSLLCSAYWHKKDKPLLEINEDCEDSSTGSLDADDSAEAGCSNEPEMNPSINENNGTDILNTVDPEYIIIVDDTDEFVIVNNTGKLNEKDYIKSKKRVAGLIKITFLFYQLEAILRVNSPLKSESHFKSYYIHSTYISSLVTFVFNLKLSSETKWFNFSPIKGMTIIQKEGLRISFVLTLMSILLITGFITMLWKWLTKHPNRIHQNERRFSKISEQVPCYGALPFYLRIQCSAIKLYIYGYMAISTVLFKCLHCVTIGNLSHLYIDGSIECFTRWIYWLFIFIVVVWVFPFFFTLWGSSKLLHSCQISTKEFFFALICPPALVYFLWRSTRGERSLRFAEAVAAKHYFMVLYEPYRIDQSSGHNVMWECRVVFMRLVAVLIFTFIINPVIRLYFLLLLLMVCLIHHVYEQPYYDKLLNRVETLSLVSLSCLATVNLFWAHDYMVNVRAPNFEQIGEVFIWFELIVLALPVALVILSVTMCIIIRLCLFIYSIVRKKWLLGKVVRVTLVNEE